MGHPMFFLDAENDDSRFAPAVTRHTYSLDGLDTVQLEQRLSHLERALSLRGGKVTSIKRRVLNTGRPQAIVRYELPALPMSQSPAA
jgi:hypothetical protein